MAMSASSVPKRIHKLDETVVNKIAAGEIIVRPANAIKEMIENSLDAGATEINITVKSGGLDMIQIQDNGWGIKKDDLPIVCERFTTSKIEAFEDLSSLSSFGFRGEALSSISYIAKVKIITRTADAVCAFQVDYGLGKPLGLEKPCAGNVGTIITVQDFFYNNLPRRSILNSASEEYVRLQEVVTRYAIRYPNVGFSLKKFGEHVADIRTVANSTTLDNCKNLFGNSIARELLAVDGESDKYRCKITGYVTNPNYSIKKFTFLLFINGRSVDCPKLRKSLELLFATHLPKHCFPFIYLSLELPPNLLDVNIHPTKAEVRFRFEEEIVAFIYQLIHTRITSCQESRTFMVQTQLSRSLSQGSSTMDIDYQTSQIPAAPSTSHLPAKKSEPRKMVRTDNRAQTLDAFLRPGNANQPSCSHSSDPETVGVLGGGQGMDVDNEDASTEMSFSSALLTKKNKRQIDLRAVLELQETVEEDMDMELRKLISEHKFVGCASHNTALIQHKIKLYAVDVARLSEELFYQLVLYDFGNFGLIKAAEPVALRGLLDAAMEFSEEPIFDQTVRADISKRAVELLTSKAQMMTDYFSIQINTNEELVSLPMLLPDYIPPFAELPMFVARLVTEVDWNNEKECFDNFARITAQFYNFRRDFYEETAEGIQDKNSWKWTVEHILFPAFSMYLQPGKSLKQDKTFVELADLPSLYKVFERC